MSYTKAIFRMRYIIILMGIALFCPYKETDRPTLPSAFPDVPQLMQNLKRSEQPFLESAVFPTVTDLFGDNFSTLGLLHISFQLHNVK